MRTKSELFTIASFSPSNIYTLSNLPCSYTFPYTLRHMFVWSNHKTKFGLNSENTKNSLMDNL